ncbi:MAG: hypothetical protein LUI60_01425 [Clostridia bacterium]|nr:hypothetical protein [Clostridia bacterium]
MVCFGNDFYDGEDFISFDVISYQKPYKEITLAVSNRGKISIVTYDLFEDRFGRLYFEYSNALDRVYLRDLELDI